jgi:hypothetical protein
MVSLRKEQNQHEFICMEFQEGGIWKNSRQLED